MTDHLHLLQRLHGKSGKMRLCTACNLILHNQVAGDSMKADPSVVRVHTGDIFVTALGRCNILRCNPSGIQISNRDTGSTNPPDLKNK